MNLFNMLKKKEQALAYLTLQYSANLKNHLDFNDLCDSLRLAMHEQGIFPKAGVRVKAHSIEFYSVADGHSNNGFIDMVLRIGTGRSAEMKEKTGKVLMSRLELKVEKLLRTGFLALALEIVEIDPEMSWKINPIHKRLSENQ